MSSFKSVFFLLHSQFFACWYNFVMWFRWRYICGDYYILSYCLHKLFFRFVRLLIALPTSHQRCFTCYSVLCSNETRSYDKIFSSYGRDSYWTLWNAKSETFIHSYGWQYVNTTEMIPSAKRYVNDIHRICLIGYDYALVSSVNPL